MKKAINSAELPLMEAFHTVQGEGYHTGRSAFFIRLGGCDVGCHWCDVKESWDASQYSNVHVEQMAEDAWKSGAEIVVVTGGEPLMYNLDALTAALKERQLRTHIETSGAYPLTGNWDWICFSPKKFKAPLEEFYSHSHELKVIVYNKSDLNWGESHLKQMNDAAKCYLQPEWSKSTEMSALIVEFVKLNPKWQISLQTHKYLDIP